MNGERGWLEIAQGYKRCWRGPLRGGVGAGVAVPHVQRHQGSRGWWRYGRGTATGGYIAAQRRRPAQLWSWETR